MLTLHNLSHSYDAHPVLHDIDLTINQGEIFCLLGPSGCGKTTLLRCIAGLEQPDSGEISFDGQSLSNLPVHERGLGLMFQDLALFPHMNVTDNIAFGLKMQQAQHVAARVQEVLKLVGLSGFETRDVSQLSGGERQRIALARSLAPNPRLLMLDEPLGSLDAALRSRLVLDLRRIIKQVGLTALYVTHDQQEAFAIADRVAIMNAGQIEQTDTPQQLYLQPKTTFAARFMSLNNIVPVERYENGTAITPLGNFALPVRAECLLLHPIGLHYAAGGTIAGQIVESVFQGESYRVKLRHASGLVLTFSTAAGSNLNLAEGDDLCLSIAPEMVIPLVKS